MNWKILCKEHKHGSTTGPYEAGQVLSDSTITPGHGTDKPYLINNLVNVYKK